MMHENRPAMPVTDRTLHIHPDTTTHGAQYGGLSKFELLAGIITAGVYAGGGYDYNKEVEMGIKSARRILEESEKLRAIEDEEKPTEGEANYGG